MTMVSGLAADGVRGRCRTGMLLVMLSLAGTAAWSAEEPDASRGSADQTGRAAVEQQLAAQTRVLRARGPAVGIRGVMRFALEAAAADWNPADVAEALATARSMQELRPDHPQRGNFRWTFGQPEVSDRNAVAFALQLAAVLRHDHADRLDPQSAAVLDAIILDALPALHGHHVKPAYTNIFLMKVANLLLLGRHYGGGHESTGAGLWREWLDFTRAGGVREYTSPTYTGVALDSLALVATRAADARIRRQAGEVLAFVWTEIAAQWFAPAERLAGAHSRDYDYLFGRGYLDEHLAEAGWLKGPVRIEGAGWLPNARPAPLRAFRAACRWVPDPALRDRMPTPRMVVERVGPDPWQRTTNWVGPAVAAGVAGRSYSGEDKLLAIHLPGGPGVANLTVVFDGRGDPYGTRREPVGYDKHLKALHLVPFLASSQRGPRITAIYAWAPPAAADSPVTRLDAHLILPADASVTTPAGPVADGARIPIGSPFFVERGGAVAAFRLLVPGPEGAGPEWLALVRDPDQPAARRITAVFADAPPSHRAVLALDVEVQEPAGAAARAAFLSAFAAREVVATVTGDVVRLAGSLPLEADLRRRQPLVCEPLLPPGALLLVEGVEVAAFPSP